MNELSSGFNGLTAAVWALTMTIAVSAGLIAWELHQLRAWAEAMLKW